MYKKQKKFWILPIILTAAEPGGSVNQNKASNVCFNYLVSLVFPLLWFSSKKRYYFYLQKQCEKREALTELKKVVAVTMFLLEFKMQLWDLSWWESLY